MKKTLTESFKKTFKIELLTEADVLETEELWREVFFEDSKEFTDYYFKTKATRNSTFVCKTKEDEIVGMVHLTPYDIMISKTRTPSFYIVGVGTKKEYRHQGIMRALLESAFEYAKAFTDFVFLMPADPKIYEPFDFHYIYERCDYRIPSIIDINTDKEIAQNNILVYINYVSSQLASDYRICSIKRNHILEDTDATASNSTSYSLLNELSSFANKELSLQYIYYVNRDNLYYSTLIEELESEKGCIYAIYKNNTIIGYFTYALDGDKPFIQEVIYSSECNFPFLPKASEEKKPIIMAKNLKSKSETTITNVNSNRNVDAGVDYVNLLSHSQGYINEVV